MLLITFGHIGYKSNHDDKLQYFTTINMNEAYCEKTKPQTLSFKTLLQEVKKFNEVTQLKATVLPDELNRSFNQ